MRKYLPTIHTMVSKFVTEVFVIFSLFTVHKKCVLLTYITKDTFILDTFLIFVRTLDAIFRWTQHILLETTTKAYSPMGFIVSYYQSITLSSIPYFT